MMLVHGVKLLIIEVVQKVLTCPVTEFIEPTMRVVRITPIWKSMRDKSINLRWRRLCLIKPVYGMVLYTNNEG